MLTDNFLMYLVFQMIIFAINYIGYQRVPFLCFIGIIATISISVQTILAFDQFAIFGVFLVITNVTFPIMGIDRARKGE